jgi:hypothetical protein
MPAEPDQFVAREIQDPLIIPRAAPGGQTLLISP